jgi:tRNA threonylcarbamoyladenosine biosynthesis protein TsaB
MTPEEAARWAGSDGALIVGSAAPALAALVREAGGDAEAQLPDLEPHARSLAALAPALAPVAPVSPLYLRPPDVRMPADAPLA